MALIIAFFAASCVMLTGLLLIKVKVAPKKVDLAERIMRRNSSSMAETSQEQQDSFFKRQERFLLQSGTGITLPVYYLMIAVSFIILYLVTNFLLDSKIAAILVACTSCLVPRYILQELSKKKRAEFDEMYIRALKRMASSLRSGSTLLQAVEDIVHTYSLPRTIREEMAVVLLDFEFKDTFEQAFMKMYERTASEDVKSTALSIQISMKYGAKLYEALEGYASAIMMRKEMEAESRAKLSSVTSTIGVISVIPFLFAFLVRFSDPTYFDGLYAYAGGMGRWILLALFGIDIFGFFFLRNMCNIRI